MSYRRTNCRLCRSTNLLKVLDLGKQPLAGGFLKKEQFAGEKLYPLEVYICKDCYLVQVLEVVDREEVYREYFYLSSVSSTLSQHFVDFANTLHKRFLSSPRSFAIEIGSNDGVLLKPLKSLGVRTLGFEPAVNVARIAREAGVEVVNDFFTEKTAAREAGRLGKADVITASNVFAHIDDLDDVMRGVVALLKEKGVFAIEVHYLLNVIRELQYDTIYNEHMNYYSLRPLMEYFKKFGMEIFDVERLPMHAGGLRIYSRKKGRNTGPILKSVSVLYEVEKKAGLYDLDTYLAYEKSVRRSKEDLLGLLSGLRSNGKKIVGYGASGRGNTILNYCGLDTSYLEYIVDASPLRRGRFTPGTHIPIVSEETFRSGRADYAVLLAWSYAQEILGKERAFLSRGGKFIVPLPEVKVAP